MEKLEITANRQENMSGAHSICNLKFNVPNEIPIFFITV